MAETDDIVRWTVKVSRDTDISLRSFLAQRGMKKGDLSKFIELAVQKLPQCYSFLAAFDSLGTLGDNDTCDNDAHTD